MRLAVFGGTFDPPHNGHLALCLYARELLGFDRLLISVSNNPFKHAVTSADIHRRRMAALLSDEINATGECSAVSGWELSRQLPSYTIDLIHYVRELYPMAELTLLVGEDSYRDLPRWKSYEDIVKLCGIIVFRRKPGEERLQEESDLAAEGAVRFIDFDMPISASDIRQRVSKGLEVSNLLPSPIRNYIAEHNLYR